MSQLPHGPWEDISIDFFGRNHENDHRVCSN